jgi:hypothetical protein
VLGLVLIPAGIMLAIPAYAPIGSALALGFSIEMSLQTSCKRRQQRDAGVRMHRLGTDLRCGSSKLFARCPRRLCEIGGKIEACSSATTAVFATLRDKLRSGDVWVVRFTPLPEGNGDQKKQHDATN